MPQLSTFLSTRAMLLAAGILFLSGCASQAPPAEAQTATHPEQALIEDLVLANRMLASRELAVPASRSRIIVAGFCSFSISSV